MLRSLEQYLRESLAGTLPGAEAQLLMSPRPRFGWKPGVVPPGSRPSAALLLLYPRDGEVHLLLTVRSSALPHHAGQVALPGGAVEPGETIESAALREAEEEVGIRPGDVRLLGRLSPLHIPVSGFGLYPVVGILDGLPPLDPKPAEVDRVLEIPLETFRDESLLGREIRELRGREYEVPFYELDGEKLWGATAMVVSELLWLMDIRPEPWR